MQTGYDPRIHITVVLRVWGQPEGKMRGQWEKVSYADFLVPFDWSILRCKKKWLAKAHVKKMITLPGP